jgi:hypothetical protein
MLAIATLIFALWAAVTVFYISRKIFGPAVKEPYVIYLWRWIAWDADTIYWLFFLGSFVASALLGSFALAHFFHRASTTELDLTRFSFLLLGLLSAVAVAVGIAVVDLLVFGGGGYSAPFVLIASIMGLAVPLCLAIVTAFLVALRIVISFLRVLLLNVFDVASSPMVSPFTYASSLLGVCILLFKVLHVAIGTSSP